MLRERTWIIIADGGHVTGMESRAGGGRLLDVPDLNFAVELPATHKLVSDRAGRSFDSRGRARHAMEARTDPHRKLKRDFANAIAKALNAGLLEGRYEHLVLVAPPATLGDLRAALAAPTRRRIRVELPSDLVKMSPQKLRRHVLSLLSGRPAPKAYQPVLLPQHGRTAKRSRIQ